MADAIPTPTDEQNKQEPRSTVVVQKPMSQWEALKEAGWWAGFDWTMSILLGAIWVTTLYWKIFGDPSLTALIVILLINVIIMLVWLLWAVMRCALFVLRLNADIATMPENAARIAVAFLSGKRQ